MQDDLTDATRWAIAQGVADPGRICIYGASYGAYAALMGVAKEPALYRCAAGYVGGYALPLMTATDRRRASSGRPSTGKGAARLTTRAPPRPRTRGPTHTRERRGG